MDDFSAEIREAEERFVEAVADVLRSKSDPRFIPMHDLLDGLGDGDADAWHRVLLLAACAVTEYAALIAGVLERDGVSEEGMAEEWLVLAETYLKRL